MNNTQSSRQTAGIPAQEKTAYFDRIDGASAWWALALAIRGWKVLYFDRTRLGKAAASAIRVLSGGRVRFVPVEYQVGDFRGLAARATRLALEATEKWSLLADNGVSRRLLDSLGQPRRARAYVKKAMFLGARRLALRLGVYEGLVAELGQDGLFVAEGSATTRWFVKEFQRVPGEPLRVWNTPALPARAALALELARYYAGFCLFVLRRRVVIRPGRSHYLLARPAVWPVGQGRGDDFLVDGEEIVPSDLLIYYNSNNRKPRVEQAVQTARSAGYGPIAWDRVRVSLRWLVSPGTLTTYLLQPLLQTGSALLLGRGRCSCQVAVKMLRLRRQMAAWDVFFETYHVGCLIEIGFSEADTAATMSAHSHGGITARIQVSDSTDELNEDQCYLTTHIYLTWGQGIGDLWKDNWCADDIVPVGYVWDRIHHHSLKHRTQIRARYGVTENQCLIAVFDEPASKDSVISDGAVARFYDAVTALAGTLDNTTIVAKPKAADPYPPIESEIAADGAGATLRGRWIWGHALETDPNELIAVSDLVISMSQSSIIAEALVCGVPAITLDETGRDWRRALARPDALVVDNGADLCRRASDILQHGIDPQAWEEVQERVRYNYGGADGLAISRMRSHILDACGVKRRDRVPVGRP